MCRLCGYYLERSVAISLIKCIPADLRKISLRLLAMAKGSKNSKEKRKAKRAHLQRPQSQKFNMPKSDSLEIANSHGGWLVSKWKREHPQYEALANISVLGWCNDKKLSFFRLKTMNTPAAVFRTLEYSYKCICILMN